MDGSKIDNKVTLPNFVTENHVKTALEMDVGCKATLVSWATESLTKEGDNFMSEVLSIKVCYNILNNSKEKVYVAKCNPRRDLGEPLGSLSLQRHVFKKEIGFYTALVPDINAELICLKINTLRFPKYIFSSLNAGQDVIIMENLKIQGYRMVDRMKGFDVAHAMLVIQELARLHAASFILQAKTPNEDLMAKYECLSKDLTNFCSEAREMMSNLFSSHVERITSQVEQVDGYDKEIIMWLKEFKKTTINVIEDLWFNKNPLFDVVNHGDIWSNNTLFRYDDNGHPVEVALVDFQVVRKGSAGLDINNLLYSSLSGPQRRANLHSFLSQYYATYCSVIEASGRETPFTFEELRQEFHRKNLYGLIIASMNTNYMIMEYFNKHMDDNISDKQKKVLMVAEVLKPFYIDMLDEMKEYGHFK